MRKNNYFPPVTADLPVEVNELPNLAADSASEYESLCPIDEITGWRRNDLSVLLDPNTPDFVRDAISRTLRDTSSQQRFANMSDSERLDFIVSRYVGNRPSLDLVRDEIVAYCKANNIPVNQSSSDDNVVDSPSDDKQSE